MEKARGGQAETREKAGRPAGPGIPAEARARVFERFQRVPGDPTRGSGLGLPIAKAIADRHRGSILLEEAQPQRDPPGLAVRVRLAADAAPA